MLKEKGIVVPGEILAQGMDYIPGYGTFRDGEAVIALQVGLLATSGRVIRLIPLSGRYIPKKGDLIIGKVADITFSGWRIDIGWAFEAGLNMKEATSEFIEKTADLTQYFDFGDIIAAQIIHVSGSKIIDLTAKGPGLRKLRGGRIIEIAPSKVPRLIGKQGSMITLIKEKTGCRITVGQNGKIWINGSSPEQEMLAIDVVKKIEHEAHLEGLTDRIKEYLERK